MCSALASRNEKPSPCSVFESARDEVSFSFYVYICNGEGCGLNCKVFRCTVHTLQTDAKAGTTETKKVTETSLNNAALKEV